MGEEKVTMQEQDKAQDTPQETLKKKQNVFIILGATLIAAILIIASVILYHKFYYADKWYKHTYINEVDVSGQTLEESKKTLEKQLFRRII